METAPLWIGIDVAKAQLDIAIGADGPTWSVANDDAGIATLLEDLRRRNNLLDALLTRRRQISGMIVAEHNRLGFAPASLKKSIEKHIRWLQRELGGVDADLSKAIQASPVWRAKDALYRSVPGIGPVISRTLIADLPELGRLSHREIASLVGLAPLARDSGIMKGKRMIFGGRASVRSMLYMAAIVGVRHNSVVREFYVRLRDHGKPPKVALIACAHKLLTILNSMSRTGEPWRTQNA